MKSLMGLIQLIDNLKWLKCRVIIGIVEFLQNRSFKKVTEVPIVVEVSIVVSSPNSF